MASTLAAFPSLGARPIDVQNWLISWFTSRDIKHSKLTFDKSLWLITQKCSWNGMDIRMLSDADLMADLVSWGMADYVAVKMMLDISAQKVAEREKIIPTPSILPPDRFRAEFIASLPLPSASALEVSSWLSSWFDLFDLTGIAKHTIENLGLDGADFRKTLKEDRTFIVGTLHLRNGFSWEHMFAIAEDVREAIRRETIRMENENEVNGGRNIQGSLSFRGRKGGNSPSRAADGYDDELSF